MLLLYCQNALVSGSHDDSLDVPASAYGTGVRIIPYDQPLSTLPRYGPAPPQTALVPNPVDTRPYQQPVETNHILIMYSSQCRYNYVTAGFNYTAIDSSIIPVQTDRTSQMLLGNLAYYAASLAPTTAIDFTQNNVHYPATAQDVINMNNQFNALSQKYRSTEATCLTDLNLASPTILVYADVDTRFAAA
jgi:hypothetical protein